jgi:RNA polymerase sigma-70 factor (ECF subfamily)
MNELPAPPAPANAAPLSDPERWVEDHGDYLYACALLRLRDSARAQDAVQETFLAALRSRSPYAGKSAERAWLVGILKHKIYDHFRKVSRETSFTDLKFYEDDEDSQFVGAGPHRNAWVPELAPGDWPAPGEDFDRAEFWTTLRRCASRLPGNVSRAFLLRELDGLRTKEIAALLDVTENNLWVMLHRARMALRRCLEKHWFGK